MGLLKFKTEAEPNPELELIYKQTRQLLCDSGRKPSLLINPPQEVFASLMSKMEDPKLQNEIMEIFVRLLTSDTILPTTKTTMSQELAKVWKSDHLKYKSQTDSLLVFLYKLSSTKPKLWKRVFMKTNPRSKK